MAEREDEAIRATTAVRRWLVQGSRAAVFLAPDWTGLRATPALLAGVIAADLLMTILGTRLVMPGPSSFYWRSLGSGWLVTVLNVWGCWIALRRARASASPARQAADAATLFALICWQVFVFDLAIAAITAWRVHQGHDFAAPASPADRLMWLVEVAWIAVAQVRLAWAGTPGTPNGTRLVLPGLLLMGLALATVVMPFGYWQADAAAGPHVASARVPAAGAPASAASGDAQADDEDDANGEADPPMLKLTQQVFESQQHLLAAQLDAVPADRPGVVDLYAITFAPYADVDVFMRESAVVAGVMDERFDARGHTLQLVNNIATVDRFAWATPLNLQRAIERVAQRMNRDQDILFIHLTSHGGADGRLAAEFFPLTVDQLTPRQLRRWLDEAGVRNRVISISACFSGSWIAPLQGDDTLVMTAADADHTSYGCGSKSTLTFFGQAMYDEQLRHTWSFEQAHAAARTLIAERERSAGKDDGYSNPQISEGAGIRQVLERLAAQQRGR